MGSPSKIYLSECGKTVVLNAFLIHGFAHAHEPMEIMINLSSNSHGRVIWVLVIHMLVDREVWPLKFPRLLHLLVLRVCLGIERK